MEDILIKMNVDDCEDDNIYKYFLNHGTNNLWTSANSKVESKYSANALSDGIPTVIIDDNSDARKLANAELQKKSYIVNAKILGELSESTPLLTNTKQQQTTHHHPLKWNTKLAHTKEVLLKKKGQIWFSFYILFYVVFLIIGSLTFQYMEVKDELKLRQNFRITRQHFLQKYSDILDADLEGFINEVLKINGRGISALKNATSSELNWSFGQALFFSSTVVTTIGYGHVTPLSQNGKIFCIMYAIIGIPLTLVLLSAVVERLLIPANWMLGKLNSKLGHLYQPFNIRILHLTIIVLIFGLLFLLIPTMVFAYLEPSWSMLDSFYYCFISLTTIGLGDYIPGDEPDQMNRSLYKIGTACYLILGLIAVMLTLTVFYDIPQLNLGQLFTESGVDDSEKLRLSLGNAPCYSGPSGLYIPQRDDEVRRSVVRIRPHGGDDSPSPDDPTPMHARDIRVP